MHVELTATGDPAKFGRQAERAVRAGLTEFQRDLVLNLRAGPCRG